MPEKFYGVKITDATEKVYYTEVEVSQDISHNINVQTLYPINGKYPYIAQISKPFYWSGTITAAFENNEDGECEHDYELGDAAYRVEFIEWLHNGFTKKLFLSNKLILPVAILGEINVECDNTIDDNIVKTSFQWVQIGEKYNE